MKRLLFWGLLASIFAAASGLEASEVLKVSRTKKLALINSGSEDGVPIRARVCFYSPTGKKMGCGRVTSVKPDTAVVKVSSKLVRYIKPGTPAQVVGITTGYKSRGSAWYFKGYYTAIARPVLTYRELVYRNPGTAGGTFYGGSEETGLLNGGLNVGTELMFSMADMQWGLGLKYRTRSLQSRADYLPSTAEDKSRFIEIDLQETAFSVYFLHYIEVVPDFSFAYGLDVDMSTLKLSMNQKSDGGENNLVFDGSQQLTIISLVAQVEYLLQLHDMFGLGASSRVLLPVSTMDAGLDGAEIVDEQIASGDLDGKADLEESLGAEANMPGFELILGAYLSF